jgi:hypothetical protein
MRVNRKSPAALERLEARQLSSIQAIGGEFRVNTYTTDLQHAPAIAMDPDGNFVVAWHSAQDGSETGIFAQRYNAAGLAQGGEIAVNTYTTSFQQNPSVAMDASGDFVVAWHSPQDGSGAGVYARRYNAAGVAQGGEIAVNTYTTGFQQNPSVAMDASGGFVIAWESADQDGSAFGVYARGFSAAGVPQAGEIPVNTYTTSNQARGSVAMDDSGDFVVAWESREQDGSSYGVYARRFDSSGVPQGGEIAVNSFTTGPQFYPSVAMDATGDFVVAWTSDYQNGDVYARRFDAAGVPQGGEFAVNTYTTIYQRAPLVAMDASGDFVVAWQSLNQDGSSYGIYAQPYNAAGVAQGGELRINTFTTGDQRWPKIRMDADGDFVVAWGSGGQDGSSYGVYAQRYGVVPEVTASSFHFGTAPQRLNFTLSHNVTPSLAADDLRVRNLTTAQMIPSDQFVLSYDAPTNTATFSYVGGILPDGNYRATLLAAGISTPQGATPAADYSFDFFVLAGDANRDRIVDITDLGVLATNWQASSRNFSQGDFSYDGAVDITDLGILATNWQKSLPGPSGRNTSGSDQSIGRRTRNASSPALPKTVFTGKKIAHGQELLAAVL